MTHKPTKKPETLDEVHQTFIDSFTIMDYPLEGLQEIVAEDVMGYGTTRDEKIHDFEGYLKLVKLGRTQSADMDVSADQEVVLKKVNEDKSAIFVDEVLVTMKMAGGNKNIIPLRVTSAYSKVENQWQLTHWHGSQPVDTENDTWHLDEWKNQKEELEKQVAIQTAALQKQNHELEIEAALEHVRATTLSMKEPADMLEICRIISEQLQHLGIANIRNIQTAIISEDKKIYHNYEYFTSYDTTSILEIEVELNHIVVEFVKEINKSKDAFFTRSIEGRELKDWINYRKETGQNEDPILEGSDSVHYYFYSIGQGALGISTYVPLQEDEIELFKQFSDVFKLAYRRFTDIQFAIGQAHEAQIQLALERVRVRTMAMQHSNELSDAAFLLAQQVRDLGIAAWGCAFHIYVDNEAGDYEWFSNEEGYLPFYKTPRKNFFKRFYEKRQNGETLYIEEFRGKKCKDHYDFMLTLPVVGDALRDLQKAGISLPESQIDHVCYFRYGYLLFVTYEQIPEAHETFKRFAKEFEQTYTRFLDLKKAEDQAREAQIEAALERVRARTMGMHNSTDVGTTVFTMFEELVKLGVDPNARCGIAIFDDTPYTEIWTAFKVETGQVKMDIGSLDMTRHPMTVQGKEAWDMKKPDFSYKLEGQDMVNYYSLLNESDYSRKWDLNELPDQVYHYSANFQDGIIFTFSNNTVSNEIGYIFRRFAVVFNQTYHRYLDLIKAEAQAMEAQVETALERTRSLALAMRESSDLFDIVVRMREEFIALGHEADYFWHMEWLHDRYAMSMTTEVGNRLGMVINVPKFVHESIESLNKWEKGDEPSFVLALDAEGAWDYIDKMNTYGHYEKVDPDAPTKEDIEHIGGLTFVIARTTHGEIGFSLAGEIPNPPKESIATLERFASVFDLAYQRFEDLQKSEKQASKIREERDALQQALKELKSTQSQLIHSEKMASLGELTAGIAHEIQNPLNFVNNFSDLNKELISDLKEAVANNDQEEVADILQNLEENEGKVTHHGKRAELIVKSMLQHSRTSSGEKELTDLNELCDEYLRLAYHGLRAKDKNGPMGRFNSEFELDLDPELPKVEVVPQDMGRVLLNLINNAFQAVSSSPSPPEPVEGDREANPIPLRAPQGDNKPLVVVRTQKLENSIIISVSDNGPGIPEDIKEKIFEPFFTTKPTGQGTGLGLSMSYDIVTKGHGGTIEVESEVGKGTVFIINLSGV